MKVKLTDAAKAVIVKDAEASYPYECCGFMYGTENGERVVTMAVEVNNTREENRERRFEISPLDYMKAERFAEENGLLLLGVYHSHPKHPAIASEHDLKQAVPYFSYVIVSVMEGKADHIMSWQLNDEGQFDEEIVVFENNSRIKPKSRVRHGKDHYTHPA